MFHISLALALRDYSKAVYSLHLHVESFVAAAAGVVLFVLRSLLVSCSRGIMFVVGFGVVLATWWTSG